MARIIFWIAVLLFVPLGAGCSHIWREEKSGRDILGLSQGPSYEIDWSKVGTGEQAVTAPDDRGNVNGMPVDMRTK